MARSQRGIDTIDDPPVNDRRSALLAAAIEEIAANGTRGLRVEVVAKRAGVSAALIYHHFGDRATLLRSALEYVGEQADAYTDHAEGSGREVLVAVLADEIQDDPRVRTNSAAWGELRDTAIFDASLRPTIAGLTERWIGDIAALVRDGQVDGSIDAMLEPSQAGVCLTALVEGISSRWLTGMMTAAEARDHLQSAVERFLGPAGGPTDAAAT